MIILLILLFFHFLVTLLLNLFINIDKRLRILNKKEEQNFTNDDVSFHVAKNIQLKLSYFKCFLLLFSLVFQPSIYKYLYGKDSQFSDK